MTTRVVNMRREPFDVYIGRPGKGERGLFGNPYRVGATCERCDKFHATAGDTLPCYESYLRHRLETDREFCVAFFALAGKTLGCFCKPGPCHGDVMAKVLDSVVCYSCEFTDEGRRCPSCLRICPHVNASERYEQLVKRISERLRTA